MTVPRIKLPRESGEGSSLKRLFLVVVCVAAIGAFGLAVADYMTTPQPSTITKASFTRAASLPSWRKLRKGAKAYTGNDGGGPTTLTVCDTAQNYFKFSDGTSDILKCSARAEGLPITVASNDVVAREHDDSIGPDYVVKIQSDTMSWSGWTSLVALQPRIPINSMLKLDMEEHLAPQQNSDFGKGRRLKKGTITRLISQDPKGSRSLYVRLDSDPTEEGWLFELAVGTTFVPSSNVKVTYQFDCDDLVPLSHFYKVGNYTKAFKEIEPLATTQCPKAQHLLAVMYGKGQGVKVDPVRAYSLLLLAYTEGMTPVVGAALAPVLGHDPNESEIVQFAATLTQDQLSRGEDLAAQLNHPISSNAMQSLADTIKYIHLQISRYQAGLHDVLPIYGPGRN